MLINEVRQNANLTKKAIEYYTEQELVSPAVLENGYRDFSLKDVEQLKKISLFRKLGLSVQDIKAILADETGDTLQKIAVQKEMAVQRAQAKRTALDKLCRGHSDLTAELEAIELNATITEKLLELFPGYYGRFVCLHFARFLNEPIATEEERHAYSDITTFLDNVPSLVFPDDVQTFLDENTKDYSPDAISTLLESVKHSIENPETYLTENSKEVIEQYYEFRQSDAYKDSPISKMQAILKEFNRSSGYYDVFIPAMKILSKPYTEYCHQMKVANEILLSQYPEIMQLIPNKQNAQSGI